jgi:hypothetical protein
MQLLWQQNAAVSHVFSVSAVEGFTHTPSSTLCSRAQNRALSLALERERSQRAQRAELLAAVLNGPESAQV